MGGTAGLIAGTSLPKALESKIGANKALLAFLLAGLGGYGLGGYATHKLTKK